MKFRVRDDLLNEEMWSFLTIRETTYTVGKEKSKFEINGIQVQPPIEVYLKYYYFLYISEGEIKDKRGGKYHPQIYISYYNRKVVKTKKIHINTFVNCP